MTVLAAFAVGGVSGSKNGRAPALDVGGSGARNGAALGSGIYVRGVRVSGA